MSHFFAIDVETANPSMASICQIGVVEFRDGQEVHAESWLIDPQDWFAEQSVAKHGINAVDVQGAPTFEEVVEQLAGLIGQGPAVCHTHYDRVSLNQACERIGKPALACEWLDSARIARRSWAQFADRGYGLASLAAHLGIEFRHHDALEDARTCGLIFLAAIEVTGCPIEEWPTRLMPASRWQASVARDGHDDGPLSGEKVVFTGTLVSLPSKDVAADQAAQLGASVQDGPTRKTTVVVVGQRELQPGWAEKSNKHRRAEELIAQGYEIRIMGEADWLKLCQSVAVIRG